MLDIQDFVMILCHDKCPVPILTRFWKLWKRKSDKSTIDILCKLMLLSWSLLLWENIHCRGTSLFNSNTKSILFHSSGSRDCLSSFCSTDYFDSWLSGWLHLRMAPLCVMITLSRLRAVCCPDRRCCVNAWIQWRSVRFTNMYWQVSIQVVVSEASIIKYCHFSVVCVDLHLGRWDHSRTIGGTIRYGVSSPPPHIKYLFEIGVPTIKVEKT